MISEFTDDNRVLDSMNLLSRKNPWDSLNISYDILINNIYDYVTKSTGKDVLHFEEMGKDVISYLLQFLVEKKVANFYGTFNDIRLLTIFFNNYSRENFKLTNKSQKVNILALDLIGFITYLNNPNDKSKFHFGSLSSSLTHDIPNMKTKQIYNCTTPYFEISYLSEVSYERHFWDEMDKLESLPFSGILLEDEVANLKAYKEILDTNQFNLSTDDITAIDYIWKQELDIDTLIDKIELAYQLELLQSELDLFQEYDSSSSKYGAKVYHSEKEYGFHKNIYPFLANSHNEYDLVLSELTSGNKRHDIVLYKHDNSLSVIIELKVNDLSSFKDDLEQLSGYIELADKKRKHFMRVPTFGVLAIYYIGQEDDLEKIDLAKLVEDDHSLHKLSNNFYYYFPEEEKPILIALFNGK